MWGLCYVSMLLTLLVIGMAEAYNTPSACKLAYDAGMCTYLNFKCKELAISVFEKKHFLLKDSHFMINGILFVCLSVCVCLTQDACVLSYDDIETFHICVHLLFRFYSIISCHL